MDTSLRYGGGSLDIRNSLIRTIGFLQRKKVVILNSNAQLCGEILASSNTKGTLLEHLIAIPAWSPVYSIESMDGECWEQLSRDFKKLLSELNWRDRLPLLIQKNINPSTKMDSEQISKLVLRIFYELLFDQPVSTEDENLFFIASLEWRKEIAVKGKASQKVKKEFWNRLNQIIQNSNFKNELVSYQKDPARFLSLFAQPFLLSPQINISDIFVSSFYFLRKNSETLKKAKEWAHLNDRPRLEGIILESIRLQHPFPILERELQKDFSGHGVQLKKGTQVMMLMDQFLPDLVKDQEFFPERWLAPTSENPYHSIPFAAGPRMCVGKPIAMEVMFELLKAFLTQFSDELIQPSIGHLYSGRDNDGKDSLKVSLYQIKIFTRALWKSFWIGIGKEKLARCPFKNESENTSI